MTIHTILLERPAITAQCSKQMKGKTKKVNGIPRASWIKPCPNRAVLTHRGRSYCQMHAPKHAID